MIQLHDFMGETFFVKLATFREYLLFYEIPEGILKRNFLAFTNNFQVFQMIDCSSSWVHLQRWLDCFDSQTTEQ